MATKTKPELPSDASALIALARVAHRNGDRKLEQSALGKLARDYGIDVRFPCCESVARDLHRAGKK